MASSPGALERPGSTILAHRRRTVARVPDLASNYASFGDEQGFEGALLEWFLKARPAWQKDALCREPAYAGITWFPSRGASCVEAKRVCQRCLCFQVCQEWSLAQTGLVGVWGGLSANERRQVRAAIPKPPAVPKPVLPKRPVGRPRKVSVLSQSSTGPQNAGQRLTSTVSSG